ncbi:VOC family protein [Crenothrix polyspora]|uniref:Lactoylglutathione lyase n=1 Tax=Crenothrix polyspora TaxID=360316 RepID=A0A1R4HAN5_9GAMM|nr:VOC family protein [Crenothrix polyspora]SJM93283.1 Lactoylglutathione lyase [Crenothrix polyspora]
MKVLGINHINIVLTEEQLTQEIAFYAQVLGLTPGYRAPSTRNGAWLYSAFNEVAVIHLSVIGTQEDVSGENHFHHVAFTCSGIDATLKLLTDNAITYRFEQRNAPEMTQVFIVDPVGIRVELNFPEETVAQ